MLITKSEVVARFVLPAVSVATPAAIENLPIPATPPAPDAFAATKFIDVIAAVVKADVVIAQPVDSAFLPTSDTSKPVTDLLKVMVIVALTLGAVGVAVKFPPDTTFAEVKVTVGRTVSIWTLLRAVDAAEVVLPLVCVTVML